MTELEFELEVAKFRDRDCIEMTAIVDDPDAVKLLCAWSNFPMRWECPEGEPPKRQSDLWEWLWSGVNVRILDLADRASLCMDATEAKFRQLMAAHLIYPNSTISPLAREEIERRVLRHKDAAPPKSSTGKRRYP